MAFVVDVFACRIVGYRMSSSVKSEFVLDASEQEIYARKTTNKDELVHHSERDSQYLSIQYTNRLIESCINASVGSTCDSYDNTPAETINGYYKTGLMYHGFPRKTKAAVEMATLKWIAWFNNKRVLSSIGYIQSAKAK